MLPKLLVICPPGPDVVIRHYGKREVWYKVCLLHHELDYFCLFDLWPGWEVWECEGRYISVNSVQYIMGHSNFPEVNSSDF
jgi:hypothetical protein